MTRADEFRQSLTPTRKRSWKAIARQLEQTDPELFEAVVAALADELSSMAAIHRSLEAIGVDIGYSSLVRWRDDVVRG